MFDNDEFQRLNSKYGPFTLDACASAFDAKCPEYCSIDKPFETSNIRGHNIFFNPPFDDKILPMLKHFQQIRQKLIKHKGCYYPTKMKGFCPCQIMATNFEEI